MQNNNIILASTAINSANLVIQTDKVVSEIRSSEIEIH